MQKRENTFLKKSKLIVILRGKHEMKANRKRVKNEELDREINNRT